MLNAKALGLLNFLVKGDSTNVISWVIKKERGPWKFDRWLLQIIDFFIVEWFLLLGSLFKKIMVGNALAKHGARHFVFHFFWRFFSPL